LEVSSGPINALNPNQNSVEAWVVNIKTKFSVTYQALTSTAAQKYSRHSNPLKEFLMKKILLI